jgi:alkaline phosphatase
MNRYSAGVIIRLITVTFIFFLFGVNICFPKTDTVAYPIFPPDSRVKNIVFFIGDGMGLAQIAATRIKTYGAEGRLNMERMPVTGLINIHSANKLITCSAAAATAFATGYKTNNGMVSINPEGKNLRTILEACRDRGMATGIVVTSTITHHTPSPFAAHVKSRRDQDIIAQQLLENRINVLLGGGKSYFIPHSDVESKRNDEIDLIAKAKSFGYSFVQTREELTAIHQDYVLGLFQLDAMTTYPPEPSLEEMTQKALGFLGRKGNGFFLMVEGSQIDWACHNNIPDQMIRQTRLFDDALKTALEFARMDKQTLVIVTADHETGGMGIKAGTIDGKELDIGWNTKEHTAAPVILFAFGPQAERFTGLHDNTEVPRIFAKLLGLESFPMITE